jgi:hypothetical protein
MPKAAYIQTNFTAGQLSKRMAGRVDVAKYFNGVKRLENAIVFPQGGVSRRGGSKYIASGKTGANKIRLVPFEFSVTQAYILEFGNLYIRVYKDQGVVETGSPSSPVEITTTYTTAQLFDIKVIQSADTLFITHQSHEPRTLTRSSHTAWTFALHETIAGPLLDVNITATTLTPSGTTGSINITASSTTGVNGGAGFTIAVDKDRIIEINQGGTLGHAKITAVTSTTIAVATVQTGRDFASTAASTNWSLGQFYTGNWPNTVAFYEQRLVLAGPPNNPQMLAFSVSGDYSNHLAGANASDAMVYTIATDQVNAIQWLNPGPSLIVGTSGGEFIVAASSLDEALTPTNVRVTRQTSYGSYGTHSKRVGNVVLFIQRAQRKIREFVYRFDTDTFVAPDLTLLSEDITVSGIVEFDYQQEPDTVLWSVLTGGPILGMTYLRDQEVVAWHKHILAGVSDAAKTAAKVESVAIIPGTADDGAGIDEVWISTLRYINGSEARHIEVITPGMEDSETLENAFFVDGGLSLDSPLTLTGITQAKPVVISSSSHGMSDGGLVDLRDIAGTTELNGERFRVFESATNSFEIMAVKGYSITAATRANPCALTILGHPFVSGDQIGIINVSGMTNLNGNGYTVTKVDANNITIGVDSSSYSTYTSGGTSHLARDGTTDTAYISRGTARVASTAISGLSHLEGEIVSILANGAVQPDKTVASGAITLDTAASIVHVGLGYTSRIVLNNIESGSADGTAQGKIKRVKETIVRMVRSVGLKIGPEDGPYDVVPFRSSSDSMNDPPALFTGDKKVPFPQGYSMEANIELRQDQPLPWNILSVIAHLKTND